MTDEKTKNVAPVKNNRKDLCLCKFTNPLYFACREVLMRCCKISSPNFHRSNLTLLLVNNFFDTHLKSYVDFERQFADVTTRFLTKALGSIWFLNANIVFIFVWIVINLGLIPGVYPFDPYPFGLLLMIASFSAMLLAIVVLINQNQHGRMADIRQRIDFEVNVRAEHEITKVLNMLDELNTSFGMVKADKELDKMKEKINIAEIKEDIEEGIERFE